MKAEVKNRKEGHGAQYSIDDPNEDGDEWFMWKARVFGPKDSPHEGAQYNFLIHFPFSYPHVAPKVRRTPITKKYRDPRVRWNRKR